MSLSTTSIRKRLLEVLDRGQLQHIAEHANLDKARKYSRKYLIDYLIVNWDEYCSQQVMTTITPALKA